MKKSLLEYTLFTLIIGSIFTASAYSQENNSPPKKDDHRIVPTQNAPIGISNEIYQMYLQDRLRKLKGIKPRVHHELRRNYKWIKKLRKLIRSDMKLTTDQLNYIDDIIGNHVKLVMANTDTKKIFLSKLNKKQAGSENNSSTKSSYDPATKKTLRSANGSAVELIMNHMEEFVADVRIGIPEEKKKEFDKLVVLWDLTNPGPVPDGPMRRLNRIIISPTLRSPWSKRDIMTGIIYKGMKSLGPFRKQDLNDQQKVYLRVKKDIFEMLSPEERIAVDAAIKFIEDDARASEAIDKEQPKISSKADG